MIDVASLQNLLAPLFPGLMGVRITEASSERVVAEMDVRPDLCTAGAILHGGAYMAFADTLGAVGTVARRQDHDHHGLKYEVHRRGQGEHDSSGGVRCASSWTEHDGVADSHPQQFRQAVRGRHADPTGA